MPIVLITRPRKQSQSFADALRLAGFEPVFFPVIQIRLMDDLSALKEAMTQIDKYAWIIFSSTNAVDVFFSPPLTPPEGGSTSPFPSRSIPKRGLRGKARMGAMPKIAAIGSKTEASLKSRGVEVDFVPKEYVGEAILAGLGDVEGKWILLPRAKVAREVVPQEITKAGGIVHEIAIYETLPAVPDAEGLDVLREGVNVVTFTSPSTVKNFVEITKASGLDPLNLPNNPLFACIGPVTEKVAREAGFSPIVVAKTYTTDGLVEILKDAVPERKANGASL